MAYATGSVNNLADLLTAIRSACTSNGWTLAGDVLYRDGCYMRIQEVGAFLVFLAGNGIDGSNNLTTPAPVTKRLGLLYTGGQPLVFPLTYEVHLNVNPVEVYVIINYAVDHYEWAAWGRSDVAGLPGSGNWFGASVYSAGDVANGIAITTSSGGSAGTGNQLCCPAPFWRTSLGNNEAETYIHHGFDGGGWSSDGSRLQAIDAMFQLVGRTPNAWNQHTVLIPIQGWWPRPSNKVSLALDLGHARYCRVDNHDPGDTITLGADQWRIYPFYRKNTAARNGGSAIAHTGTMGWAIRYTGG